MSDAAKVARDAESAQIVKSAKSTGTAKTSKTAVDGIAHDHDRGKSHARHDATAAVRKSSDAGRELRVPPNTPAPEVSPAARPALAPSTPPVSWSLDDRPATATGASNPLVAAQTGAPADAGAPSVPRADGQSLEQLLAQATEWAATDASVLRANAPADRTHVRDAT